jgi:hypothetical protein
MIERGGKGSSGEVGVYFEFVQLGQQMRVARRRWRSGH